MKNHILIVACFCCFPGFAQWDTIQVSKKDKIVLVLPDNISDAFIGNELKFFMDFENGEGSSFTKRILKLYYNERAIEKKDFTSLTVITENGNSYEFTLELSKNPRKPTYYIAPDRAITNILGKEIDTGYHRAENNETDIKATEEKTPEEHSVKTLTANVIDGSTPEQKAVVETKQPTKELYREDPQEYYRLRCYYMQFDRPKLMRVMARKDGVFLWLDGVYYNENELYLQFRLENKEGVDLDVNFMKFSIATAYRKSSSNQKTELESLLRYKMPKHVEGNTENHFVVVFQKFALDRNTMLTVDMDELNGSRDLSLEIDHHLINNPVRF